MIKMVSYISGAIFWLLSFAAIAQQSDIRITSASSSSNGSWAYSQSGAYTFSPTADNAILSAVDLQNKLGAYTTVEINTARVGGTQTGNVNVDAAVSQLNFYYYSNSSVFRITCAGELQINANMAIRTTGGPSSVLFNVGGDVRVNAVLDLSGGNVFSTTSPVRPANLTMTILGNLIVGASGKIWTKGWRNDTGAFSGLNGGNGASQTYTVSGSVSLAAGSILDATGGGAVMPTYNNNGGTGGSITINAVNSIILRGSVLTLGGNGNNGGTGGALSIISTTGSLDYSGVLSSEGGYDYGWVIGGNGGNITLSALGGLSLQNNVNAGLGRGTSYTGGGIVTLSTGNTTLTTGGGVNDGLVGGAIIRGSNFIKSGVGVLRLDGVSVYSGSTSLNGGSLYLSAAGALPSGTSLSSNTATVIDLVGNSLTLGSLDGGTKITSSSSGIMTLTVGSNNLTTSHTGVMEDGLGQLSFVKNGTGTMTVTGANSYSGNTTVNGGILSIGHSTGLGTVLGGTSVSSGGCLQLFGGINVGTESLSLVGVGPYSRGAFYNLSGNNSFAGEISVVSGVRVTAFNGTLNLIASNVLTGTNANLLFGGYGILSVGGIMNLGTGGITYDGGGSMYLLADNIYSGLTQVTARDGVLRVGASGALGATSSGVVVSNLAALELVGGISVLGESLTVSGLGVGSVGGSFRNVSGDNVWSGTITMGGTLGIGIGSASGKLSLTGSPAIASSTYGLKIYGMVGGVVELEGETLFTGELELLGGSLLLGGNERIADVCAVKFNGGDFSTGAYSETLGNISLYAPSSISLGNAVHDLRFSGAGVYDYQLLSINGWQGSYASPGSSGMAGRIYVGISSVLNRVRLDQLFFNDAANSVQHFALQLSDGEIVPGANSVTNATGQSNVRISSAASNFNGTWTTSGTSSAIFTPTGDNAILSASDLQAKILTYQTVEIKTIRTGGRQAGSVVFDGTVTQVSGTSSGIFKITSADEVQFNSVLELRLSVNSTGMTYAGYTVQVTAGGDVRVNNELRLSGGDVTNLNPVRTGHVTMVIAGDLLFSSTGKIFTKGWKYPLSATNYNGGIGGNQTYTVSGLVNLAAGSVMDASGGDTFQNTSAPVGGNGGTISITATNAVVLRGSVLSAGGKGNSGGTGGTLNITSNSSYVDYSGVMSSLGGLGNYAGGGGNGGNINLSGLGGLSIRSDLNTAMATGMTTYSYKNGGTITLNTGNLSLTTGGGMNDGVTLGVIRGGNLIKNGVGILALGMVNVYLGSTTVNAGKLYLNVSDAIPSTSDLVLSASSILDLHGFNNTLNSITGAATSKITNSDAGASTLKFGAGTSTYNGLIEDGSGMVHIEKVGAGVTTLGTTANTFSGLTKVSAGTLVINHAASLGGTSAGTEANGGYLRMNGVTVSGESLTLGSTPSSGILYANSGANVWNGPISLSGPSSILVNTGASLHITPQSGPAIQGTNTNLVLYVYGNLNINGEIATGNATLTKNNAGTLTLNGANSYNGITTLSAGQTIIQNDLALGSNLAGTVISAGANLTLDGVLNVTSESLTMTSNAITLMGALSIKNGASNWSGNMNLSGTAINWTNESDFTVTGMIANGSTLWTVGSTGNLNLNGVISGVGGLEKTGSGVITLGAANTYTGLTRLTAGRLSLGRNEVISNSSNMYFNGGTLSTEGFTESLGQLFINDNSTLEFGTGSHAINFASAGTFTPGKILTVRGWDGMYSISGSSTLPSLDNMGMLKTTSTRFVSSNGVLRSTGVMNQYGQLKVSGQRGTAGNLVIGSLLSGANLSQIMFFNASASTTHYSVQLGSNEIVPDYTR